MPGWMLNHEEAGGWFSWLDEFDLFLRKSNSLLYFVIDAALNSDGIINKYLTRERQAHRDGLRLKKQFTGFLKAWQKMPSC